jgi:hypothetical protein
MWLYGFNLLVCYANDENNAAAARPSLLATVLPEMYDLASKYNLPDLKAEIEVSLRRLYKENVANWLWLWPMVRYLWSNLDSAVAVRGIVLEFVRELTSTMPNASQEERDRMAILLRANPQLAIELLLSGGLDGNGPKLTAD